MRDWESEFGTGGSSVFSGSRKAWTSVPPRTGCPADGRAVSRPAPASPAPTPSPMNARRFWLAPLDTARPAWSLMALLPLVPVRCAAPPRRRPAAPSPPRRCPISPNRGRLQRVKPRERLGRRHHLGVDLVHRAHCGVLHVLGPGRGRVFDEED